MKFSTIQLLTLLTAGSALSYNPLFARDAAADADDAAQVQCIASMQATKCFSNQDLTGQVDYDELCRPLKDEKCISLLNNGVGELDGCKNLSARLLDLNNKQNQFQHSILKLLCEKDEEGKECPFATVVKNEFSAIAANQGANPERDMAGKVQKIADETCKSERCTLNTVAFFSDYNNLMVATMTPPDDIDEKTKENLTSGINEMKAANEKAIEPLKADKCLKAQVLKSGATSNVKKLGSSMLLIAGVLYYLL